jgi:hypothetical protein
MWVHSIFSKPFADKVSENNKPIALQNYSFKNSSMLLSFF